MIVSRKTGDLEKQPLCSDQMSMAHTPQAPVGYHQPASVDGPTLSKSFKPFLHGHKESSSILQKSTEVPELTQEMTVHAARL